GTYLVIHGGWRSLRRRAGWGAVPASRPAGWAGRLLSFLAVVFGWVLFRSDSLTTAGGILRGMLGLNGLALPAGLKD
ncbi:MBOAT family protein, partial [Methylococcus sp. S2T]